MEEKVNKVIYNNRFESKIIGILESSIVGWTILEYFNGAPSGIVVWSILMLLIYIISISITLTKFPESKWLKYFICCSVGADFMGIFLFANCQASLGFAFAAITIMLIIVVFGL